MGSRIGIQHSKEQIAHGHQPGSTKYQSNTGNTNSSNNLSSASAQEAQVTEQQFLQLLVAQLKNQDPLNPMDGTQFVSQLAQFSQLEQMIGVNQGVQQLVVDAQGTTTGAREPETRTAARHSNLIQLIHTPRRQPQCSLHLHQL